MSKYKLCKNDTVKCVVVEPNKKPYEAVISNTLRAKQKIVGGLIEYAYYDDDTDICCNEEYRINELPFNREIRDAEGNYIDYIGGTFFIIGKSDEDGNDTSLTDEQVKKYINEFDAPWFDGTKNEKRLKERNKEIEEIMKMFEETGIEGKFLIWN